MKFKTIFLVFNILFLFSAFFIFLMPFFVLGTEFVLGFWRQNLALALVFPLVFLAFNLFFLSRRHIYALLEAEDWRGLKDYLERRLYRDLRISPMRIRLLINAYFVLADMNGMARLETFLREERPRHRAAFGLELGLPLLIKDDPAAAEPYFSSLVELPGLRKRDWVLWCLAFSRASQKDSTGAGEILKELIFSTKDPVLKSLSLYLLGGLPGLEEELQVQVEKGREELRKTYTAEKWEKKIEKAKENLEILVLLKLIQNASAWQYAMGREDSEGERR